MSTEGNGSSSRTGNIAVLQTPQNQRSQATSRGCSTPYESEHNQSFVSSDISSVGRPNVLESSPRKRGRSSRKKEAFHEVPQASPKSTTLTRNTESKQFGISVLPKQTRLEEIVSHRLQSFERSMVKALMTVQADKSETSNDDSSVDVVAPSRKKCKIYKGNDWKLFKAIHEDTIYYTILQCSLNDARNEAGKWVQHFEEDPEKAIFDIIQFLVDLCGHQELDVSSMLKFDQFNFCEIVNYMQEDPPKYQQNTGKYLMKSSSNWGKQIHNTIYQFIESLLELSHSKEIIDSDAMTHLFGFLVAISISVHKPLVHTGIVIVAKMTSILMPICLEVENKIQHYLKVSRIDVSGRLEQLNVKKNNLHKLLGLFHGIIEKHCCHPDASLNAMKVTCLEEMWKWFMIDPSMISTSKYFRKLMRLVQDASNKVRLAALTTCYKLVATDKFSKYMDLCLEKFVEVVLGRTNDIDCSVAVIAVKILTAMINTYPNAITMKVYGDVPLLIYDKHCPLAMAAGKFFIDYICSDGTTDSYKLIVQLITFVNMPQMNDYIPLLVEALLNCCREICDWKMLTDLLLSNSLEYEYEKTLIHIMCQAVQQTVTGKSKICRIKSCQRPVDPQKVRKVSDIFLVKLPPLLKKYSTDPKCSQMLLEILMVVDFEHISITRHATELDNIMSVLRPAFIKNTEPEVLETISKVFARFCEDSFPLKNRYIGRVLTVKQAVMDTIQNFKNDLDLIENPSEDDLYSIELGLLRLSVLFIYHDMTEVVEHDMLFNYLITLDAAVITPNSLKYIITSSYWFLSWNLQQIIQNVAEPEPGDGLQQRISQVKSACTSYIDMCFQFMRTSESEPVRNEAFTCLCDLLLKFRSELKNPMKHNPILSQLIPTIDELVQSMQLLDFAQGLLFHDNIKETLKLRRTSLGNIMNLGLLNVIGVLELTKLYKHYYTHNDDYGDIFDDGLKILRETNVLTFAGIILQTLLQCHTSLCAERDAISDENEEVNNLRKLAKQFQMFVGRSTGQLNLLLQLGIKYAAFSENRHSFLDYLKYFSTPLSPEERKQIVEFLMCRLPERNKNNENVTGFVRYVDKKPAAGRLARKKSLTDTSTTLETATQEIENVIETSTSEYTRSYDIEDDSSA